MATNDELKHSIDALTKKIGEFLDSNEKLSSARTVTESHKKETRVKELNEKLNETTAQTAVLNEQIEKLNANIFHQRNILDEISEIQGKIKKVDDDCLKIKEKLRETEEGSEEYIKLKLKLEEKLLKKKELEYNLTQKEAQKRIEGYNILDEKSEEWANRTKAIRKGISEISDGIKKIGDGITKALGPWTKMSQAAADYAKNIGLSGRGMDQFRKATINAVANRGIGAKYNTSVEELMKLQQGYTNKTGRQIQFSNANYETIAATSKILGEEGATEMLARFENFGLSVEDAGKRVGKMFSTASKSGLSLDKLSKNIRENLNLAQKYTFRNGTRGLESMAKKATELNLNMSQAAAFAERVNTVEGAIKTGAQLQVLGGPFAQMADPIGMLYEGLNDLEGLQDRMTQMFGNLGSFNKQTGEVELSAFNKVRIREAAKAMGVDENNIFEAINSSARRNEIANQLGNRTDISKETMELIKNVGTIQNGVAGVNINGEFVEAAKITNKDAKALQEISRSESDDVKDIAVRLRGWDDAVQGFKKQKDAVHGQLVETSNIGKGAQKIVQDVADMKGILIAIAGATIAGGVIGAVGGIGGIAKGVSHVGMGIPNLIGRGGKSVGSKSSGLLTRRRSGQGAFMHKGNAYTVNKTGQLTRVFEDGTTRSLSKSAFAKNPGTYNKLLKGAKLAKVGGAVAKGATIAGLVAIPVQLGTNYYVGKDKSRRGKFVDYAGNIGAGMAGGAATGAWLGSMLGPYGTIIGAGLGAIAGGVTSGIGARKRQLNRHIDEAGVELYGDYSMKELKQIRAATRGEGKLSEDLKEKMRMKGDSAAIEQISNLTKSVVDEATGALKVTNVNAQKKAGGGIVEGNSTSGDRIPVQTNAGEMVLNQGQQATLFNAIKNNDFSSISGIRKEAFATNKRDTTFGDVVVKPREDDSVITKPQEPIEKTVKYELGGTWNINIGGTINAVSPDGTSKKVDIDIDALKKTIEENLMKKISEGLARMEHGGRILPEKGYFYQG